jgi:hypothetical protein
MINSSKNGNEKKALLIKESSKYNKYKDSMTSNSSKIQIFPKDKNQINENSSDSYGLKNSKLDESYTQNHQLNKEITRDNKITNNTTQNSNSKYNPWENKSTFVQDVGEMRSFLNFLEINNINCEEKSKSYISSESLEVLKNFDFISKQHFESLSELEFLYEKFRNESLLSNEKNWELLDKINYLNECLKVIENSKIKIANILHNTNLSDSSVIKIKQSKKVDFLKLLKIIVSKAQDDSNLEMINLSFNLHKGNIKNLTNKYDEIYKTVENFTKEYEKLILILNHASP